MLNGDKKLFTETVLATAQHVGISSEYIEKIIGLPVHFADYQSIPMLNHH